MNWKKRREVVTRKVELGKNKKEKQSLGTSVVVNWLRLHAQLWGLNYEALTVQVRSIDTLQIVSGGLGEDSTEELSVK